MASVYEPNSVYIQGVSETIAQIFTAWNFVTFKNFAVLLTK